MAAAGCSGPPAAHWEANSIDNARVTFQESADGERRELVGGGNHQIFELWCEQHRGDGGHMCGPHVQPKRRKIRWWFCPRLILGCVFVLPLIAYR